MKARSRLHLAYIAISFLSGVVAALGILIESAALYALVPGLMGAAMAGVSTVRFLRFKTDLAGFVVTTCGFVFYQAFQFNPVTLPDFDASISVVAEVDRLTGIFLGNFTTGLLLIALHACTGLLGPLFRRLVPGADQAPRAQQDGFMVKVFVLVFSVVALPHVLFGQVVKGAYTNIVQQRSAWSASELGGFTVWGGPIGASLVNVALWATSLFLLWIYLLRSRRRVLMYMLAPLVLLWTAGVAFQGSRTYLVMLAFGALVYFLGHPAVRVRAMVYAGVGCALLLVLVQIAALYRTAGLQAFDLREIGERLFEIRGNEGMSSQMDGIEYFRTEMVARETAPNPFLGLVRGLFERPVEGLLMPVPRTLFPWKPVDDTARDFTLFFQNVRLGVPSDEAFLGASPGMIGRELIRYGFLGPVTLLFWLGSILALADRLYATAPASDFHRIFAATLVAFVVAQMRDWVPMWVLPFLPALIALGWAARRARRNSVRFRRRVSPVLVLPQVATRR